MIWYFAIVALLNIALGYGLAVFMGRGPNQFAVAEGPAYDSSEFDDQFDDTDKFEDDDEWES